MKEYKLLKMLNKLILIACLIFITGCGVANTQNKTEYYVGEEAEIDNYIIEYKSIEKKDNFLKVNLELANNNKELKIIDLEKDFVIYNSDSEEISINKTLGNLELKAGESKNIELVLDITDIDDIDDYKIIFYSRVATNNIALILKEE